MNRSKIIDLLESNIVLACNVLITGANSLLISAGELEAEASDDSAIADARALRGYAKFQRDLADQIMNASVKERADLFINNVVLIHNMLIDDAVEMEKLVEGLSAEERYRQQFEVGTLLRYAGYRRNLANNLLDAMYNGVPLAEVD